MANIKSAIKRAKQSEKSRKHNASIRSEVRTYIKKVTAKIASGDWQESMEAFRLAQIKIDKAAAKKVINANMAARTKSRLNARIKALKENQAA